MQINEAFIVSSVRTAVGKANKGSLRNVRPEHLGATAVRGAIERAGSLSPDQIEDLLIGCAFPEGPQGMNIARVIAQKAGLSTDSAAATINRFCSSGLQTIAQANNAIVLGQSDVIVAGGTESMSSVPMGGFYFAPDTDLAVGQPDVYASMGMTAENVADQYDISREGLRSRATCAPLTPSRADGSKKRSSRSKSTK